jgi:hypothetical protein
MEKHPFLTGKSSINGTFRMAALVYCRVCREQFETVLKLKSPTAIFHYDLQVIAAVKKKKTQFTLAKDLKHRA